MNNVYDFTIATDSFQVWEDGGIYTVYSLRLDGSIKSEKHSGDFSSLRVYITHLYAEYAEMALRSVSIRFTGKE